MVNENTKFISNLSRYLWTVRPPSQNSAKAKKLSGDPAARKSSI
ncbi:S-layer homology domain-containing protein, partial [Bacillus cereus]|nr:S-layer homology domain-containing protein [Bacillus cereus]